MTYFKLNIAIFIWHTSIFINTVNTLNIRTRGSEKMNKARSDVVEHHLISVICAAGHVDRIT